MTKEKEGGVERGWRCVALSLKKKEEEEKMVTGKGVRERERGRRLYCDFEIYFLFFPAPFYGS